jgi:hypothetical protein
MADALPTSGQIDPTSFPYLLVDLHRQGATGSLKVESPSHQKALYFRSGRVLFGSSNDPQDQLGAILIESGKLTHEQFEDVNKKVGPGNPLAKALADSGLVSQRELSEAARAKVERILADVISYTEGSYEFEDGVLPKGAVDLKLSTSHLFLSAIKHVNDRGFVLRHLEGINVVLRAKTEMTDAFAEIEADAVGLPQQLDGTRTLKDAASALGIDEFEAAKVATALLFLGLVEVGGEVPIVEAAQSEEASPFFVPAPEESAELDLSAGPTFIQPDAEPEPQPTISQEEPTMMLSAPPAFDFGTSSIEPPAAAPSFEPTPSFEPAASEPEVVSEAEVQPTLAISAPEPPPTPPLVPASGPPPLKIIQPPKPAERTRAPSKPTKEELAALDELLNKKTVEGPLTPLQKPAEEEWRPQFLTESGRTRGKKKASPLSGKPLIFGGLGLAIVAVGLFAYLYLPPDSPTRVVQASPLPATAQAPATSAPTAPASMPPGVSAVPAAATSPTAAQNAPVNAASASPSTPAAPASTPPTLTTPAAAASVAPTPRAVPTTQATAAPSRPAAASGLAEARKLMRKGNLDAAAKGFADSIKGNASAFTLQLLVACSSETVQKALSAVPSDELFIIPVHYRGRDCYRVCWGVFESEARANAASRGVHDYFLKERVTPKAISAASILK